MWAIWFAIILACTNTVIGLANFSVGNVAVGCINALTVVVLYMGVRAGRFG